MIRKSWRKEEEIRDETAMEESHIIENQMR